jgi:hypothetical protein
MTEKPDAPETPELPASPKPKLSRRRRLGRLLGAFALVGVLVPTAGLSYLQSDRGGELLRGKVLARLAERTTGKPSLEKLSFSLLEGVRLQGLVLRQANGQEAVRVERVLVHPSLGSLLSGKPTLSDVEVDTVQVTAEKRADGTLSLADLFRKAETSAKPPSSPPKEPLKFLRVAHLDVRNVGFSLQNPDGSRLVLTKAGLAGELTVQPRAKAYEVTLTRLGASVALSRPDGTRLALDDLETSVNVSLRDAAGPFSLGPLRGAIVLTPAGKPPVSTPIAFGGLAGTLAPGQLSAGLDAVSALFLSVGSVKIEGHTKDGALDPAAHQAVSVAGLRVAPDTLAKVVGRPILRGPLSVDLGLAGNTEALKLTGALSSEGQAVRLLGTFDARNPKSLGYTVEVAADDFVLDKVLVEDGPKPPPKLVLGQLRTTIRGHGTTKETAAIDVTLHGERLAVADKPVGLDQVDLAAHFEGGIVTIERLDVAALAQKIHVEGTYALADQAVALDLQTTGSLQETLGLARKAGLNVPTSPVLASVSLPAGAHVKVTGNLGSRLRITLPQVPITALGASARVDAAIELERAAAVPGETEPPKLAATQIDATIQVAGLSPRALSRARGKNLDLAGSLGGTIHVHGSPKAPEISASLSGRLGAIGSDDVDVTVRADVHGGVATAQATVRERGLGSAKADPSKPPLLSLDARVPLPGRAGPDERVAITLDVPARDLASVLPILSPELRRTLKVVRDGSIRAHGEFSGTARAPRGSLDVRLAGKVLTDAPREVHLTSTVTPLANEALGVALGFDLTGGAEGPSLSLRSDATFARSPLVDKTATLEHHTTLRCEQDLARLPSTLPLPKGLGGLVRLDADLRGGREALRGTVGVAATGLTKEGMAPVDVVAGVELRDDDTAVTGHAVVGGERLVEIGGTLGLPGKSALVVLRQKTPLAVAGEVKLVDRTVASLGKLNPKLAGLPGDLSGKLTISGTTAEARAEGGFAWANYPTASGTWGHTRAEVRVARERAELRLSAGDTTTELGTITAALPLGDFLAARRGERATVVPVTVRTELGGELGASLPRFADAARLGVEGKLTSDLGADIGLSVQAAGVSVARVATSGALAVADGKLTLPAYRRTFHDVGLVVEGDEEGLRLTKLAVLESDGEKARRSLEGTGLVPLELDDGKVALGSLTLDLAARDFLVSGGSFGEHDAPRAALSGKVAVRANLAGSTRKIDVRATDLVLFSPDRQPRAHAQEELSKGDVVDGKIVPVGRLAKKDKQVVEGASPPAPGEKGLEVRVHVERARIYQAPLDLTVGGEVLVERPAGEPRHLSGGLQVAGGRLLFGGRWLTVEKGELRMTDEGPFLDVFFQKEAWPWVLRDVATEGAGHDPFVRIHLEGIVGQQKAKPEGLGDSLFEALAVFNLGQVRTITSPTLPASGSPQLPEVREIRQASFMAANLPHLAFLDRAGVQSSPTDGRFSYGRLTHVDAEKYFGGGAGSRRLRITTRPLVPGQSQGEVAHEWLFQNDKQVVSGVGLQGGTRLGGGPTLFWEWSSKE